jgi:hypothetical protein
MWLAKKDVVMLIPEISTRTRLGKSFVRAFGSSYTAGSMIFKLYRRILNKPVVLVYLLQPQTISCIKLARLARRGERLSDLNKMKLKSAYSDKLQ